LEFDRASKVIIMYGEPCESGSSGNVSFACDSISSDHLCTAFNAPAAYEESLKMGCTDSSMGTVVDECPKDDLLGSCARASPGGRGSRLAAGRVTGFGDLRCSCAQDRQKNARRSPPR